MAKVNSLLHIVNLPAFRECTFTTSKPTPKFLQAVCPSWVTGRASDL